MGIPMTKEELAKRKAITETRWKKAVALYQQNYPSAEKECILMQEYMQRAGFKCARQLFIATMLRLHVDIATETGELLGPLEEDEKVDPSIN